MDPKLLAEVEKEYYEQVKVEIANNQTYLNMYSSKNKHYEYRNIQILRGIFIIPMTYRLPPFKQFYIVKSSVGTEDSFVLNHIPHLGGANRVKDLSFYESTTLHNPPYSLVEEMKKRLTIKVLTMKNTVKEIFLLKNHYFERKVDEAYIKKKYNHIYKLKEFLQVNNYKAIFTRWEKHYFDCNPMKIFTGQSYMLFCNICFIFDCEIHCGLNSKLLNRNTVKEKYCGADCFKHGKMGSFYMEDIQIVQLRRIFHKLKNICFTTAIYNIKYKGSYTCKNIYVALNENDKSISTFNSGDLVHNNYAHNLHNIKSYPIKKILPMESKKITRTSATPSKPCHHSGSCYGNKECHCYNIFKSFCTDACFCKACNQAIQPCNCQNGKCSGDCFCRKNFIKCTNCHEGSCIDFTEKRVYVNISNIAGFGLFAGENIKKGDFVMEYLGEVITTEEADRRGQFYEIKKNSYLYDLSASSGNYFSLCVDSMKYGNFAKFINNSEDPNLMPMSLLDGGNIKIYFFAARDIYRDEEFTFNYNYSKEKEEKYFTSFTKQWGDL